MFNTEKSSWKPAIGNLDDVFYGITESNFRKLKVYEERNKPDVIWQYSKPTEEDTDEDGHLAVYDETWKGYWEYTDINGVISTGRPWARVESVKHHTGDNDAPSPYDQQILEESTKEESTKEESTKEESTKEESTKEESTKEESTKEESTKEDSVKGGDYQQDNFIITGELGKIYIKVWNAEDKELYLTHKGISDT